MRGRSDDQLPLFHAFDVEARVRADHPLRDIKRRVDRILAGLSPAFAAAYSRIGRPGVPPERLLKAQLLMAPCSVRSDRPLCERIDTDLLFRWFLGLQPSDALFDATTFAHNRQCLDDHDRTKTFFAAVVREDLTAGLCSHHVSVDGSLVESFASAKSFPPKDSSDDGPTDANGFKPSTPDVDFHGQKRTNATHRSATDPEAKLYRTGLGREARLAGPHRDKVSAIGVVTVSPTGRRLGFYFATEPGGFFTADKVVGFLRDVLRHLRGNVVVVWDRGSNHRGTAIRDFLARNRRLPLEMLPPWALELNAVEAVWSWLKYGELANFVPDDTDQLDDEVVDRRIELKFDPTLLRALWERSELPFPRINQSPSLAPNQ